VKPSGEDIRVDWHGQNDRRMSFANSLAAVAAVPPTVHAAPTLSANALQHPMELMLVNLRIMGLSARIFPSQGVLPKK